VTPGKVLLLGVAALAAAACSTRTACTTLGENLFENLSRIRSLSSRLELPLDPNEAAFIVGAAKAVSQVEDVQVEACLRPGEANETEFKVHARGRTKAEEWSTVAEARRRASER